MIPSPAAQLALTVDEGVAFLDVRGSIDLDNAARLQALGETAVTDYAGTIRIDLSGVDFMDSTGLGALIRIRTKAVAAGQVLILQRPSQRVRSILELTGTDTAFTIDS